MMKNFNIWGLIVSLLVIIILFYNFHDVMFTKPSGQFTGNTLGLSGYVVETGNINTGNIIDIDTGYIYTGGDIGGGFSDYEKYLLYKEKNNKITFNPPKQPHKKSEGYSSDSEALNQYLAKNKFYIDISRYSGLKDGGYLYIKTKDNPTDGIFMYWHNAYGKCGKPVSGKLIQSDKYRISDTEFLYPLDKIEIVAYSSKKKCVFDWQEQINGRKNQYIGGYVASTRGNTIEEITIAWE